MHINHILQFVFNKGHKHLSLCKFNHELEIREGLLVAVVLLQLADVNCYPAFIHVVCLKLAVLGLGLLHQGLHLLELYLIIEMSYLLLDYLDVGKA